MGIYFGLALLVSAVGCLPLWLTRKFGAGVGMTVIATIVLGFLFSLTTPTLHLYPLFGTFGVFAAILLTISAFFAGSDNGNEAAVALPPVIAWLLILITWAYSAPMFHAGGYSQMVGALPRRTWTTDVQPKDPKHVRLGTRENALYQANKVLGQDGAIGSQFELDTDNMTLQRVNGELQYIIPLTFHGFWTWYDKDEAPAYILVHGEDPYRDPQLIKLDLGKGIRYAPGAFLGRNLERHLRGNGFLNRGIAETKFQIDEHHKPWWVVTLYETTIGWGASRITSFVLVDPYSGTILPETPLNKAPAWAQVTPSTFVESYLSWWGDLSGGWVNSWKGGNGLLTPGTPNLVQGSNGDLVWATDISSNNSKDQGLVDLIYTNIRTGESVLYQTNGGSTDEAIVQAVDNDPRVKLQRLHGADPQLYNLYGRMTSVVPLLADNHSFQGVAFVDVKNVQLMGVGTNPAEAATSYQIALNKAGQQNAVDNSVDRTTRVLTVSRIGHESQGTAGSVYYIYSDGFPHILTGSSAEYRALPVTEEGDRIRVTFVNSGEDQMPLRGFENLSVPLHETPDQQEVRTAATQRQQAEQTRGDSADIVRRVQDMSPEQLQRLDSLARHQH